MEVDNELMMLSLFGFDLGFYYGLGHTHFVVVFDLLFRSRCISADLNPFA